MDKNENFEVTFSVIIPAYNVGDYLEKCLFSILSQTFTDYEVIVVEDGSTDNTPVIADEFRGRDNRITVIHKENKGVSEARNTGIKAAKGKYFLFFDADDFVEPYCLKELYEAVEKSKADTIIYGYHRYENDKIKETCYPLFPKEIYEKEEILTGLLPKFIGVSYEGINAWIRKEENALYVENPALWRTLVSADLIRKNNLWFDKNLKVGEDTLFITEYLSLAKKCLVLKQCYYYLVTRETSAIYVYERNPLLKLEGKIKLLKAREDLTKRLLKEKSFNIKPYWGGTVIMSCIELGLLMARKNKTASFFKRYKYYYSYIDRKEVKKSIEEFNLEDKLYFRSLPFLLLKYHCFFALFLCGKLLELIQYEFKR